MFCVIFHFRNVSKLRQVGNFAFVDGIFSNPHIPIKKVLIASLRLFMSDTIQFLNKAFKKTTLNIRNPLQIGLLY